MKMKNIILIIFTLIIGVAEALGQTYSPLPSSADADAYGYIALNNGTIYTVTTNTTIDGSLDVPSGATVTIYIPTGVTLTVNGKDGIDSEWGGWFGSEQGAPALPAIHVPSEATVIITGGGTLKAKGGNGGASTNAFANGVGGSGAAPAIGGAGGLGGQGWSSGDIANGQNGEDMGRVYILGNVTIEATKGTEGQTNSSIFGGGTGGFAPTYAIGGGGAGGAASGKSNGANGGNGYLYKQTTANIIYKNSNARSASTVPPTKTGYTFNGYKIGETWVFASDGTIKTGVSSYSGSISEYWIAKTYSVTLDKQYGEGGTDEITATYDSEMPVATAPTRMGYNFMGYFTEPNGGGTQYYYPDMSSTNVWHEDTGPVNTLYAHWGDDCNTPNTLIIKYDSNGGHGEMEPQIIRLADNIKENIFIKGDETYHKQCEFLGWNTQPDGEGTSYQPGDVIFANEEYDEITLYAQWGSTPINDTYVISTAQELLDFATLVNGGSASIEGILAADIDMSDKTWIPIGTFSNPFKGIFDGNGYTVSNLTMANNNTYDQAGLIGYALNATIKNVIVKDVTLYANKQMGAVCGRIDGEISHPTGGILIRCGSFGSFYYNDMSTSANCAIGGLATADLNYFKKGDISYVWSTSSAEYVIQPWTGGGNRILEVVNFRSSESSRTNGVLCYAMNESVSGSTSWTQTFGVDECPRPTSRSRAVYREVVNGTTKYYNIYNVYYISNGGTSVVCSDTEVKRYSDGSNISLNLPTTTREGYTFLGWYTEKEGGELISESISPITEDLVLYAHWAPISYSITLVKQGGTGGTEEIEVTYDSEMPEATAPTRTGFTFNGYFYNPDGTGTKYYNGDMTSAHVWNVSTVPDGGFKLYAHWMPTIYTVNLDKQGGTDGTSSVTVTYGGFMPTVLPNDEPVTAPTKIGATFAGYYSGINGTGTKYYNENMESVNNWDIDTNPCTLYAHWTNVYRLTFDVNGGNTLNPNYKDIIYNNEYGDLPTPTWTGHTFDGWFTSATGGEEVTSETKMGGANETVYAHWTIITYTVTLYLEGGSGGTTSVEVTYGSTMPSATAPTRPGYIFGGYYTGTNGTGTQYYNVDMTSAHDWDIDVYPINSGKLYANWTPITYTVTFNPQKGSVDPTTKDVNYGNTYGELPTPTRHGFLFKGWYTTENGGSEDGTEITGSETYSIIGNQTLYAHWNTTSFDIDAYSAESPLAGFYFRTFFDSQVTCILPAGVTAYKGNIDGRYLVLTAIVATDDIGNNVIPKNVPVILRMDPNENTSETVDGFPTIQKKTITLTTTEYDPEFINDNNGLIGSDDGIATAPANSYILSFGSKGLGFYAWANHPLEGHKAYVINSSGSSAKALIFRFEDDAAGISQDAITDFDSDDSELVIHNLNGIRISKPQKGINIINGKKVWVK